MKIEKVILVDEKDIPTGEMEKMEAHEKAMLHRAVSVFIFNSKHQMLIQQRAMCKYHSPGLWTNTACTHPYPGESSMDAAKRRLQQEMGLEAELHEIFDFIYKEKLDNELTEYEYDHVFIGYTDDIPVPDPDEVGDYKYIDAKELINQVKEHPASYTVWFKKIYERVLDITL